MALLYHRFMTPEWLANKDNVEFGRGLTITSRETYLSIGPDSGDYDKILKVPLPVQGLKDNADITVKILVGIELPVSTPKRDPLAVMISAGSYALGFQILDPDEDYAKKGPYIGIEGEPGFSLTRVNFRESPNPDTVPAQSKVNPDQFELTIKPSDIWGSAFCTLEDGHKLCISYSRPLKLSQGLALELYRQRATEEYTLNYIEVWIYDDAATYNAGPKAP